MKTMRTAMILLALCPLTAIDARPSGAETYRPWCVHVLRPQRRQELRFHLVRTMHDDGGPRHRRFVRAEPVVPVVRPEQPQHHGPGWPGEEMIGPTCQLAHMRDVKSILIVPGIAGVEAVTDASDALKTGEDSARWT